MATPLLLYVVGLQPHMAIGTGALAVSVNAFANFAGHARAGHVRWRCAVIFAVMASPARRSARCWASTSTESSSFSCSRS